MFRNSAWCCRIADSLTEEGKSQVGGGLWTVAYYLKSMLGLAEIRVSAAAHLLSNEARSWTAAHSARRRTAPKGNEADGSAAHFRAEGELAVNRRRVFKELPNLEVALLKKKDKKKKRK